MVCLPTFGLPELALAMIGLSGPVCIEATAPALTVGTASSCDALQPGLNEDFMVDGEARSFYLDLPTDVDSRRGYPVVFTWHGLLQDAEDVRPFMADHVDHPERPFIAVTPEDTDVQLKTPMGELTVDWDVFDADEGSKEVELFDAVLACVDERWGVDEDRIHSVGVSLGGVVTDYLGVVRGDQLASVASFSGGYWSNPAHDDPILSLLVSWPEEDPKPGYAQLLAHGGDDDQVRIYDSITVDFQDWAEKDADFLRSKGHEVVRCDHGQGHDVPEALRGPGILRFLFDHPRYASSPWSDGLPSRMPGYCSVSG